MLTLPLNPLQPHMSLFNMIRKCKTFSSSSVVLIGFSFQLYAFVNMLSILLLLDSTSAATPVYTTHAHWGGTLMVMLCTYVYAHTYIPRPMHIWRP